MPTCICAVCAPAVWQCYIWYWRSRCCDTQLIRNGSCAHVAAATLHTPRGTGFGTGHKKAVQWLGCCYQGTLLQCPTLLLAALRAVGQQRLMLWTFTRPAVPCSNGNKGSNSSLLACQARNSLLPACCSTVRAVTNKSCNQALHDGTMSCDSNIALASVS